MSMLEIYFDCMLKTYLDCSPMITYEKDMFLFMVEQCSSSSAQWPSCHLGSVWESSLKLSFDSIVISSPLLWLKDISTHRLVLINDSYIHLLGYVDTYTCICCCNTIMSFRIFSSISELCADWAPWGYWNESTTYLYLCFFFELVYWWQCTKEDPILLDLSKYYLSSCLQKIQKAKDYGAKNIFLRPFKIENKVKIARLVMHFFYILLPS